MSTRSRLLPASITAVAATALLLVGCSSGEGSDASGGGEEPATGSHDVETDYGTVTVPADPQRVVVLNYALAGYLYDLDIPVTATIPEDADADHGEFSPFWEDQANEDGTEFLPWSVDGFDLEAILAAEPDLIVGGGIGFPLGQAEEVYDELSDIAPTVLVGRELTTWEDQYSFLAEDVFAKPEVFADAVDAYDVRVEEVRETITPPELPAVFLSIVGDGTAYALVESVGLPTVFAELGIDPAPIFAEGNFEVYGGGGDMFELSTEQVGQVVTQPTVFVMGFNADTTDVATLSENPVYAALPAFQNDRAYDLPYWVLRGDYDETMALLDIVEEQFS